MMILTNCNMLQLISIQIQNIEFNSRIHFNKKSSGARCREKMLSDLNDLDDTQENIDLNSQTNEVILHHKSFILRQSTLENSHFYIFESSFRKRFLAIINFHISLLIRNFLIMNSAQFDNALPI